MARRETIAMLDSVFRQWGVRTMGAFAYIINDDGGAQMVIKEFRDVVAQHLPAATELRNVGSQHGACGCNSDDGGHHDGQLRLCACSGFPSNSFTRDWASYDQHGISVQPATPAADA